MDVWVDVNYAVPCDDDGVGFSEKVLVTLSNGNIQFAYYIHDEHTWVRIDGTDEPDVIGWTELPQPYRRKNK